MNRTNEIDRVTFTGAIPSVTIVTPSGYVREEMELAPPSPGWIPAAYAGVLDSYLEHVKEQGREGKWQFDFSQQKLVIETWARP